MVAGVPRAQVPMLRSIREIANFVQHSLFPDRVSGWNRREWDADGPSEKLPTRALLAAGRPKAILPREKISLLIRCRSRSELLLMKPRIEAGIENRVQVGLAVGGAGCAGEMIKAPCKISAPAA